MAVRRLVQGAHSGGTDEEIRILGAVCEPMEFPISDEDQQLITDLFDTMMSFDICVGLAAPQIGISRSVAVIRDVAEGNFAILNPRILSATGKKDTKRESCMSVWGLAGEVERRKTVEVRYQAANGTVVSRRFEGFAARVIQHEVDHLNGIIYATRVLGDLHPADHFGPPRDEP